MGGVTYTALMSFRDGRWNLFVASPGLVSRWPVHGFPRGAALPTAAERSRVLNALGFVFTDGAGWGWEEDAEVPGDDTSPVRLIASTAVRQADGDGR
ncbi:DUF6303 family protein [Embleya sp. NBC_00896]|uniref:DUF6303 family protein n=1 Tax=Embleya sp. NBC_00896 TaxID=2975961 RepID=UPI00386841CC|nr:DUF6303 family protein [Embleya sp. NBC_00896]